MALVSTPRGNSVVKNKYDFCQKKFVIAQKFLNTGQRKEGLRLAKQAYEIAVAYDFTQLACELASIIYHDYIYYHPHPQKAEHFAQQSERFLHNYLVEKKVEHRYFKVFGQLKGALDAADLARTIQELAQWNGQSIKAQSYQAMLVVLYGFRIGDYPLIREKCREVLAFFEYKKGVYLALTANFSLSTKVLRKWSCKTTQQPKPASIKPSPTPLQNPSMITSVATTKPSTHSTRATIPTLTNATEKIDAVNTKWSASNSPSSKLICAFALTSVICNWTVFFASASI